MFVDAELQDMGRPENEDPSRQDGNLFAGLRVPTDPLALLSHRETAE
jgi:hypothetical protein